MHLMLKEIYYYIILYSLYYHIVLFLLLYHFIIIFKKFYIILNIIVIPMICRRIVHKNCIILHFYTSCHIKENCVEFSFLSLFCSLVRNENIKRPGFYTFTNNKRFFEFSTAKTTKQNKEYVWTWWSFWIVICLSWRLEIVIRNLTVTMFLSVSNDYVFEYCSS